MDRHDVVLRELQPSLVGQLFSAKSDGENKGCDGTVLEKIVSSSQKTQTVKKNTISPRVDNF